MNKEGWDCFLELIQQAENKTILSELLDLLLTTEEKTAWKHAVSSSKPC